MTDNRLAPYGAFTLRIALGTMFIAHSWRGLRFDRAGGQG